MDNGEWTATVFAKPTDFGTFKPVLVLSRRFDDDVSEVVVPLFGEFPTPSAAVKTGIDVLSAMSISDILGQQSG